jgi:lysozyme
MNSGDSVAYEPSKQVLDLVKQAEGYASTPYLCPAGKQTIGYGHVMRPGEVFEIPLSEDDAEALLRVDLVKFAKGVSKLVTRLLEPHQFDALVSFAFNVGIANLSISDLLDYVNAGKFEDAAGEFHRWKYATVDGKKEVLDGLVTRRSKEAALFRGDEA